LHVVAYSSLYSNIAEAMTNVRGLAVVGLFFQVKYFLSRMKAKHLPRIFED